jgi:GNAT superfamily N-acetyltransferase
MANTITIRAATPNEHEAIESLLVRASLSNEADRALLLANPEVMAVPLERVTSGRVFVAEADGTIVGFASIEPDGDKEAELEDLFVEPTKWRQGVGRKLVAFCSDHARSRGYNLLRVIGNQQAVEFYVTCGFAVVGPHKTRFGPAYRMQKLLSSQQEQ